MIQTTHLFPILDKQLIELLRSLQPDDWNRKTLAKLWTVKDIAAHLLDGNLRTLSISRDQLVMVPDREIHSYKDLVDYLNRLNADWVSASKRVSTQVLVDLLETTGKEYSAHLSSLDPYAKAVFSVAWAGEETSANWFHIAREFTEKWHHQQQIRDAVDKEGIMTKDLFYPVMDTFMHGLPHTYRNTIADPGTVIKIVIDTEIGGSWFLIRTETAWTLSKEPQTAVYASLLIPPDIAWKLFTKGMPPETAVENITITGDEKTAKVALTLIAVMA